MIDIIHRIWVEKKYAERTDNAWILVRLGIGSHDATVSHTRPFQAVAVWRLSLSRRLNMSAMLNVLPKLLRCSTSRWPVVLPSDVDFLSVPTLLRHEPFKFDKPSKWGMGLTAFETYPGYAIELFCANAKPDEEYILRCQHYEPTKTSLHCVAMKDCKIADPFVGRWYLAVGRFCSSRRDKDYRRVPRRAKEAQAPQPRAPVADAKPALSSFGDLVPGFGALSV